MKKEMLIFAIIVLALFPTLINAQDIAIVENETIIQANIEDIEKIDVFTENNFEEKTEEKKSGIIEKISQTTNTLIDLIIINKNFAIIGGSAFGLLILILILVVNGGIPGMAYFSRAAVFHKRATNANKKGNLLKAKKLYEKSYFLREESEEKKFNKEEDGTI